MPGPEEIKVCPFCKEQVHPEAIKCRFCHSMLLPPQQEPAAPRNGKPVAGQEVTYVVDRGFMRFAKFVGGAVAIILALGLYLVGFDLRRTMQTLEKSRGDLGDAQAEVTEIQAELERKRQDLAAAEGQLRQLREDALLKTEELNRLSGQLGEMQKQLSDTLQESGGRRAEIEALVRDSRSAVEQSLTELKGYVSESEVILLAMRDLRDEAGVRGQAADVPELTTEEQGAREELRLSSSPPVGPRSRYLVAEKLWEVGRTLRIRFLDGDPAVQQRVIEAAREWQRHANIHFDFGDHAEAEIRISFQHAGSWSYLGTDALVIPDDSPTMNLGWLRAETSDAEVRRVVLHQFGEALGLIHEHSQPNANIPWDEDKVYRYYKITNGWSKEQTFRNVLRKREGRYREFDPKSIMQYSVPNELTVGDYEIGWNNELSESDKAFIAELYPGGDSA